MNQNNKVRKGTENLQFHTPFIIYISISKLHTIYIAYRNAQGCTFSHKTYDA